MKICRKGLHQYDENKLQCPECRKISDSRNGKARYKANPRKERNRKLKREYGITIDQYDAMLVAQNGCCNGCKRHQNEIKNSLHVDHCHATGTVRGLLCYDCNRALGLVKDNKETLLSLIDHLSTVHHLEAQQVDDCPSGICSL